MLDPTFHITTPRLYITYINPSDPSQCDFFLKLYNPPEKPSWAPKQPPISADEIKLKIIEDIVNCDTANTGFGRYLVWLKDPSNAQNESIPFSERLQNCQMIGVTSMKMRKASGCPVPDVGFGFHKPFWGKGYASEATKTLMKYFEEERGVKAFFGYTDPQNVEANALFKRLGFENRGIRDLKGVHTEELHCVVWATKGMDQDLGVYGIH